MEHFMFGNNRIHYPHCAFMNSSVSCLLSRPVNGLFLHPFVCMTSVARQKVRVEGEGGRCGAEGIGARDMHPIIFTAIMFKRVWRQYHPLNSGLRYFKPKLDSLCSNS